MLMNLHLISKLLIFNTRILVLTESFVRFVRIFMDLTILINPKWLLNVNTNPLLNLLFQAHLFLNSLKLFAIHLKPLDYWLIILWTWTLILCRYNFKRKKLTKCFINSLFYSIWSFKTILMDLAKIKQFKLWLHSA